MAYRNFYEAEITQPQGLPETTKAVSSLVDSINRRRLADQMAKRNALAQYKADSYEGKFSTDQEDLNVLAKNITEQAVSEMMSSPSGTTSLNLKERQARALGYSNQSKVQWQQFQDLQAAINQTEFQTGGKNYYNPKYDADRLMEAAYGRDGERVNFMNRTERLEAVGKTIGSDLLKSFDKEGYLSDYVEGKKTQVRETKSKSMSGYEQTQKIDAVFLDANGNPKVTDEHAIEYLQSSEYITARYQQELNQQLLAEAKKIMATPKGDWMKGLPDEQIIAELRADPSKNTVNSLPPGIRERNLAKIDLERKQRINLMNSTDAGQYDPDAGRGITSKYYTASPSFDRTDFGGSGGKLTTKSGDKTGITISLRGRAFDLNENRMTGNDRSSRDAVIKSYNLAPVLNGLPLNIKADSPEEYIQKINEIPLDQIRNMELKTVIKGQAFNRPEVLSSARVERDKLEVQPNKTPEDIGKLEALNKVLDMASMNPELEPEVIQSALRTVLGTVVEDLVKVVEPMDPETIDIQNKLGRYNIADPRNWSSDDRAIVEAFNRRKAEAQNVKEETPSRSKAISKPQKFPLPKGQPATVVQNGFEYTWDPEVGEYR